MKSGGRNLLFLTGASIVLATVATIVSLLIYYLSGDIYLDRSRPGFLPDKPEKTTSQRYAFSDSGEINQKVLDDYLKHFQKATKSLDQIEAPFSEAPLSDDSLGIPADE